MWSSGVSLGNETLAELTEAQLYGEDTEDLEIALIAWQIITIIGFILFIVGLILTITGAVLKEILTQVVQPALQPLPQPPTSLSHMQEKRLRFCTNCGREIPFEANYCLYCGKKFTETS